MSSAVSLDLSLSASYLGPVFSLEGRLTKRAQNLIFARNGTGKSFLSRALRYLDLHGQSKDISDAVVSLVSDEAPEGVASFSIYRGQKELGKIDLNKRTGEARASTDGIIFHVFSEDFVHTELREREYKIDGEIENQITVDSSNIEIDAAQAELAVAEEKWRDAELVFRQKFEDEKSKTLNLKAAINKRLKEYAELTDERLLAAYSEKPGPPERGLGELLKDLDRLKALPAEPALPGILAEEIALKFDLSELEDALARRTSPSSVSESVKAKIDAHHGFYETGTRIIQEGDRSSCPFCEQSIADVSPRSVIDAYVAYFEAEEERHKSELRSFFRQVQEVGVELGEIEARLARQKTRFDNLKGFIPSKKALELDLGERELAAAQDAVSQIKKAIEQKANALADPKQLPGSNLISALSEISAVISGNNEASTDLARSIERVDEERKSLQRLACKVFEQEFTLSSWGEIATLRALQGDVREKSDKLLRLEKNNPTKAARERVADTFELLLREFFADKYVFDKENFILKRGALNMERGVHRTLSDGEKTAIAFCYFVACAHRKVNLSSDYGKLLFVFDDPVTSMSYDYIFSIAQTLKNLSVSNKGDISINPDIIYKNKALRPELLLLTHSSYFFNICRSNRVVAPEATFSLRSAGACHQLERLQNYVAPFEQQLDHVYRVANGDAPDHGTGNAIRSVLEAIGRFCRPDTQDLQRFVAFLSGEEGLPIKSVLINSLSHGTYYDETPSPDDITLACQETMAVVERYAVGHLLVAKRRAEATESRRRSGAG